MHGLKNSYINFFIFISQSSQQASCCDVYAYMVVTMKKSGKLQRETVFCFLLWLRNAVTTFVFYLPDHTRAN